MTFKRLLLVVGYAMLWCLWVLLVFLYYSCRTLHTYGWRMISRVCYLETSKMPFSLAFSLTRTREERETWSVFENYAFVSRVIDNERRQISTDR